jgi:hypothetical protein
MPFNWVIDGRQRSGAKHYIYIHTWRRSRSWLLRLYVWAGKKWRHLESIAKRRYCNKLLYILLWWCQLRSVAPHLCTWKGNCVIILGNFFHRQSVQPLLHRAHSHTQAQNQAHLFCCKKDCTNLYRELMLYTTCYCRSWSIFTTRICYVLP